MLGNRIKIYKREPILVKKPKKMGLVNNNTPRPPNIRPDPVKLKENHVLVQVLYGKEEIK